MNDGGYGSEFHKLRADGIDDNWAVFGGPRSKTSRAASASGHEIRDVSVIPKLFADFAAQGESEIGTSNSDQVTAPAIRRAVSAGTAICEISSAWTAWGHSRNQPAPVRRRRLPVSNPIIYPTTTPANPQAPGLGNQEDDHTRQ